MKKLTDDRLVPPEGSSGITGRLEAMVAPDMAADRKFILDDHDIEDWMDSGKLDKVLGGFIAGHDLHPKKVEKEPNDLRYFLEDGLIIHAHQVTEDEVQIDTDKYILSVGIDGMTAKNYEKAEKLWYDLSGIPI